MDALPFSRSALKFMGVRISLKQSWFQCFWNYYVTAYGAGTMAAMLAVSIYSFLFLDKILVTCTALMALCAIKLATHITILRKTRNIFDILAAVTETMDKETIRKIKRFDCLHGFGKLAVAAVSLICATVYHSLNGIGPETTALFLGHRTDPNADRTYVAFPMVVMNCAIFLFLLLVQFYTSCLFIASLAAGQARDLVARNTSLTIDYEGVKKSLQSYNKLMQTVNHELGILPMSLLAMEFVMFSNGISFIITSTDLRINPYFAAMTLGSLNLIYLWCIFHFIAISSECQRNISSAWAVAQECVTDPFAIYANEESNNMRKSLKFFLLSESIVVPKAADVIAIDRSLVLSFFSQLIPFTVMMFTTIKEIDHKAASNKISG